MIRKRGFAVPYEARLEILADVDSGMSLDDASKKYVITKNAIRHYLKLREKGELRPKPRRAGFMPWAYSKYDSSIPS